MALTLTGRVFRDDETGMYVSHCRELDIMTHGESVEDVLEDTDAMIRDYFKACAKLGTLGAVLERLLGRCEAPESVEISSEYDLGPRRVSWRQTLALGA